MNGYWNRVPQLARRWQEGIVLAGGGALLVGLAFDRTWESLPHPKRLTEVLVIIASALVVAMIMRRWRSWSIASGVGLFAAACVTVFAGPVPVIATLLLTLAAIGLGTLVTSSGLGLATGLGIVAGVVGWLLPLPLHWQWSHAVVLGAIAVLRWSTIHPTLRAFRQQWSIEVAAAPWASALGALAMLVASMGCWLPTMQYDDLAYHLGLPFQLQEMGRYALDPDHQVWALAPWAGDVLQGIVQVVADHEARGALNAVWLFVGGLGIHQLALQMGATAWARWAAVSLFATLPLTMSLAAGMQTELPGAAMTVSLAWLIAKGTGSPTRSALGGGILFGILCALKVMHAATALPLLLWAVARHRHGIGWKPLAIGGLAALITGGASYLYALMVAGNPILPLENATFRSPYYPPHDFIDTRWNHGIALDLPWQLTFDTASFFEGSDGALGFVLVAAAGAWVLALTGSRTRGLTIAASAGLLLALLPLQYARYLYPSVVLLIVPLMAALEAAMPKARAAALTAALCLLQVAFFGSGYWMIRDGAVRETVLAVGNDSPLLSRFAPERQLIARMRATNWPPTGAVLVMGTEPDVYAELGTRGRTTAWYSHRFA